MSLRILLVDDFDFVRAGVRRSFADRDDWEICGEAADGAAAVAKVRELSPDVVILDLAMPGINGVEAAKQIRRIAPSTKIILFSAHDVPLEPDISADDFVTKSSGAEGLISAIERLAGRFAELAISDDGFRHAYSGK